MRTNKFVSAVVLTLLAALVLPLRAQEQAAVDEAKKNMAGYILKTQVEPRVAEAGRLIRRATTDQVIGYGDRPLTLEDRMGMLGKAFHLAQELEAMGAEQAVIQVAVEFSSSAKANAYYFETVRYLGAIGLRTKSEDTRNAVADELSAIISQPMNGMNVPYGESGYIHTYKHDAIRSCEAIRHLKTLYSRLSDQKKTAVLKVLTGRLNIGEEEHEKQVSRAAYQALKELVETATKESRQGEGK